jgi:DnaA family protein
MASGLRAIYLDAETIRPAPAAVLDGLERCGLVALDDVDALAGDHGCEAALFDLCNRLHMAGAVLLASASSTPLACGWRLSDLASRFAAAAVFRLRPLDDDGRARALRRRAHLRGIDLDARTAGYILARFERDPHALFTLLDDLDEASLTAQRRVTIPFVRALLAARGAP